MRTDTSKTILWRLNARVLQLTGHMFLNVIGGGYIFEYEDSRGGQRQIFGIVTGGEMKGDTLSFAISNKAWDLPATKIKSLDLRAREKWFLMYEDADGHTREIAGKVELFGVS